jgi:pilus assembly protein CpaD
MTRPSTVARAIVLVGIAAAIAGCKTTSDDVTASVPNDYRARHPIAIREGVRTVHVFVGTNRGGLTAAQRAELGMLAGTWRREATGGVVIEVPSGTANARAAHEAAREIRALLAASGVPGHAIEVRPLPLTDPARLGTIRINYPKMVAETGPCGLWPDDLGVTFTREHLENRPYHNFGCATQRNLAAMADNPADLVQPRAEAPALAGRRSTVLDKYRKGESTATNYPDANKGKISDVGQ